MLEVRPADAKARREGQVVPWQCMKQDVVVAGRCDPAGELTTSARSRLRSSTRVRVCACAQRTSDAP